MTDSESANVPGAFEEYADGREDSRFTGWLRERSEPAWTGATTHRFTRELDGEGAAASERRRERLEYLFRRTVELEVAFFESAYDPGGTVPGGGDRW